MSIDESVRPAPHIQSRAERLAPHGYGHRTNQHCRKHNRKRTKALTKVNTTTRRHKKLRTLAKLAETRAPIEKPTRSRVGTCIQGNCGTANARKRSSHTRTAASLAGSNNTTKRLPRTNGSIATTRVLCSSAAAPSTHVDTRASATPAPLPPRPASAAQAARWS